MSKSLNSYLDNHYINRSNWLRAAVLGANDGILSTASLAIGVAAATDIREAIIRITFWGTVAMGLTALVGYFFGTSFTH